MKLHIEIITATFNPDHCIATFHGDERVLGTLAMMHEQWETFRAWLTTAEPFAINDPLEEGIVFDDRRAETGSMPTFGNPRN